MIQNPSLILSCDRGSHIFSSIIIPCLSTIFSWLTWTPRLERSGYNSKTTWRTSPLSLAIQPPPHHHLYHLLRHTVSLIFFVIERKRCPSLIKFWGHNKVEKVKALPFLMLMTSCQIALMFKTNMWCRDFELRAYDEHSSGYKYINVSFILKKKKKRKKETSLWMCQFMGF